MNQKERLSIVNDAARQSTESSAEKSGLSFKPASKVQAGEGVYSPWPRAMTIASPKAVPASTAAKGDDDIMSTPSKIAKS